MSDAILYTESFESTKPELPKYKNYLYVEWPIQQRYRIQEEIAADSLYLHLAAKRASREVEIETPDHASITEDNDQSDSMFWRWSGPDFMAVAGMMSLLAGFVLALFPAYRAGGVLFPIGAALLAATGYWARYRDGESA
ncbi:MAG: hypothetical protein ACREC0_06540 [Methylocella sp.]